MSSAGACTLQGRSGPRDSLGAARGALEQIRAPKDHAVVPDQLSLLNDLAHALKPADGVTEQDLPQLLRQLQRAWTAALVAPMFGVLAETVAMALAWNVEDMATTIVADVGGSALAEAPIAVRRAIEQALGQMGDTALNPVLA